MSVLITGAAGFIGSHLAKLYTSPLCCDIRNDKMIQPLNLIDCIVTNPPETIFHLGAVSSTTETDTALISKNNVTLSCELLEKCIDLKIPFIYASSASVYGHGDHGFFESTRMTPLNYYAMSKAYFDSIVIQKIKDNPGAKIIGLRYFNVYGKNEDHKGDMASPVHKFLNQSTQDKEIKIFEGSADYLRDFVHIDDVITMTQKSVDFPSGIYNVGTGIPRSFLDVATIIAGVTGAKITEIPFPEYLRGKYQKWTCSSNAKIGKCLTLKRMSLEKGIKEVAT